jgi:putative membrane protein
MIEQGKMTVREGVLTVLKGCVIGAANIIPGVSGGTMALVMGIYKRLMDALHNIDLKTIKATFRLVLFRKGSRKEFRSELRRMDFTFLLLLFIGILIAVFSTTRLLRTMLENHHAATYGFFFGLILISVIIPYRYLKRRSAAEIVCVVVAAALAVALSYGVTDRQKLRQAEVEAAKAELTAQEAEDAGVGDREESFLPKLSFEMPSAGKLLWMFVCAAIAVSAMILPGISGSFILLLLGVFFDLLAAVDELQVVTLAVFALGCVVGLLTFVRLMSWLLKRFYNQTVAFMIGLMIGSLWTLWPFKHVAVVAGKEVYLGNSLPSGFGSEETTVLCAFLVGCAIIGVFCRLDIRTAGKKQLA